VPPIGAPVPETPVPTSSPAPSATDAPSPGPLTKEIAPPRQGRPHHVAPSPTPADEMESAAPTPPQGMPQVPGDRGNGGPRPGYPAPPQQ
jgi:hypothetical protein